MRQCAFLDDAAVPASGEASMQGKRSSFIRPSHCLSEAIWRPCSMKRELGTRTRGQ